MKKVATLLLCLLCLTGCNRFNIKHGNSITLRAEDRAIITDGKVVCAEPSPDAVKSIAESLALKVRDQAEISQTYASTVASIGLRTAGIQILRDLGYRACEALINDAFGPDKIQVYKSLVGGVDDAAVALVAVEGLTGMRPAPTVAVSSSGEASTSKDTSSTQAKTTPATINIALNEGADKAPSNDQIPINVYKIVRAIICSDINATKTPVCSSGETIP